MKVIAKTETHDWVWAFVNGTELTLNKGTAGTARAPNHYPLATFPGSSTVILGAATTRLMESLSETSASWSIPVSTHLLNLFERGFLIVSSIRYFAGLHSKLYDAKAKIEINNNVIDYFGLREKPAHHSDYFHRIPLPVMPLPKQVSECQTIYSWPIISGKLLAYNEQKIKITIDNFIRWDIDYIGILIEMKRSRQQIFLSHNWNDKPVARKLAKDLSGMGIGVWLDEAEIKLGDSLISKIREGIDRVDYLIVLLSKNSIDSEWVKKEVDIAMNQEIEGKQVKVIPILLDDVDLPGFLKGKLYGDLRSMDQYDVLLSQIEARVKAS